MGLGQSTPGGPLICGYWLAPSHWGQGLTTEAMAAFLADCYTRFPRIDEIKAGHFTDNPASGAVLRKLGFEQVGEGMATSLVRLEPAPELIYRLSRAAFEARQ